jgi:hypothetical protein
MSSVQRYAVLGALGILAPALLLSACGSSEEAGPSPTPSVSTSATPSASPTPSDSTSPTATPSRTAPALPEEARSHTTGGAEAFVRHYLDMTNYAQATGQTDPLAALGADGCRSCDAAVTALQKIYAAGGRYEGGAVSARSLTAELRKTGDQQFAHLEGTLRTAGLVIRYPDPAKDIVRKASSHRNRFELIAVPDGWLMAQFRAVG